MEQTKEQIKSQLRSYGDIVEERRQIWAERQRILAKLQPGGQNLDGMPRNPGNGDKLAENAAAAADLLTLYEAKERDLVRAQMAVERMIGSLPPIERKVARRKYIEGLTWEKVADTEHYSLRQVHRIHGNLLHRLAAAELANIEEGTTETCE